MLIINILSNAERLEQIKDKLSDFQTTIWDLTEDDYMFLYKQAEENARLREALTFYADKNNYEPKMNWWQQEDYELSEVIQDSGDIAKSVLEETK